MSFPKSVFLFFLLLAPFFSWAQRPATPAGRPAASSKNPPVELLGTDQFVGGEFNGVKIRKLLGNVRFKQGTTLLFCDSAYQYMERNTVDAFSNVRIVQNDTVTITGEKGFYDGNARTARMTGNVVMRDPRMTLTTSLLDYDLTRNLAYYSTGGHLQDPENTLDSQFGYYNTESKVFSFRRNVHVVTKSNEIRSDTLQYNTMSKVVYFFGPTRIVDKLNRTLYAENGTYNTITKVADFQKNAKIETPDYLLGGDKLVYDENTSYGIATGHVSMTSKKDNLVIRGDVGRYWRALGKAKVYGSPVMRNISGNDTLYLAGDTLMSVEGRPAPPPPPRPKPGVRFQTTAPLPPTQKQLNASVLYAYPRARIYRSDLQGACDSLTYDRQDSVIYLNRKPILWQEQNQLTSDSMEIRLRNGKIDQMRLYANAFSIAEDTLLNYNQVKGRNMVAYFADSKLKKITVLGNAESLYFALDGDTALTGMNKAVGASMALRFTEGKKAPKVTYYTNPDASFIPPHELKDEDRKLKGFQWRITERPTRQQVLGQQFGTPAKPKAKAKPKSKKTKTAPKARPVAPSRKAPVATGKPASR
ncbi:hypothetical protein MUN82_13090 [Hymenobacter aerilatus]|uniref:Organic solvent tolerance-like N-terminal domain-containing protein n=1 Tax=Hymenobacter aerilatus TaxID=2932251 RepID=A0A8T9SUI5_9BACT|nr:OstA-like protein [Hymenobacter aerilatus]UOR03880.1 hypothetical protein MUN82_13090 [Hymenobacter aerilatus]